MRHSLRLVSAAVLVLGATACTRDRVCAESDSAPAMAANKEAAPGAATSSADGSRAIAEADIVAIGDARLYALSKSGKLALVDVSVPGQLALLGTTAIPGTPFELYERGSVVLVMTNAARDATGAPVPVAASDTVPSNPPTVTNAGASLLALDASDPANVRTLATFDVPGEIADSRIVGNVLYLVTFENGACWNCAEKARTVVTTFDVSDPTSVARIDQRAFTSGAPNTYDAAWGMAWKRSIVATTERLYLGGQAYVANPYSPGDEDQGVLDVVDIRDPAGHLGDGAHLTIPGAILNRWQIDETGGVLRVLSQPGAGFTGNGTAMPVVETFRVDDATKVTPLARTTLTLPRQEGLRTVHFDGPRAYAITFNQTDPLLVIDLSDPSAPKQRGQLEMPGWMFHLVPQGDRVVGLGVDRTDPNGSLNVSLFDVSDMDAPKMLERVSFGAKDLGEDYEILSYEVPEDQDRIQKAFRIFDDGTIAVPFSSTTGWNANGCSNPASGVQLVHGTHDGLTKGALLPVVGNPRRAIERSGQMIAVSDSHVTSFSMEGGAMAADLTIGTCTERSVPIGGGVDYMPDDAPMSSNGGPFFLTGGCELLVGGEWGVLRPFGITGRSGAAEDRRQWAAAEPLPGCDGNERARPGFGRNSPLRCSAPPCCLFFSVTREASPVVPIR